MLVYCKKTFIDYSANYCSNGRIFFFKNNFYDISIEYEDCYWIFLKNNKDVIKFYKKYRIPHFHKNWWNIEYFEDYFYTLKEIRYKKMKKLNKNNLL